MVPRRTDWGLTQAAAQVLDQRVAYLQSDLRAEEVINDLMLDMTPGQLRSATTITARGQDLTIRIDVDMQAPDDQTAAALINPISQQWGTILIDWQNALNQEAEQSDRVQAEFQDRPAISKLRPNMLINTAIGGIGGFLLGAVIVFVLEFLEANMVRRAADVERTGGLTVLATVPGE